MSAKQQTSLVRRTGQSQQPSAGQELAHCTIGFPQVQSVKPVTHRADHLDGHSHPSMSSSINLLLTCIARHSNESTKFAETHAWSYALG